MPGHVLQPVLEALERGRILACTADDPPRYLPAREPARITLVELLDTVRSAGEEGFLAPASLPVPSPLDALAARIDRSLAASLQGMTLADLATVPAAEQGLDAAPAPGAVDSEATRPDEAPPRP